MDGENPGFAPVLGLSRALMLEQPSLQFAVLNVDDKSASSTDTPQSTVRVLDQLMHEAGPDFEFAQRDGILHISRWDPDGRLSKTFRLKQNKETIEHPLAIAGRCELGIKDPGQMDTFHFVQKECFARCTSSCYIEEDLQSKSTARGRSGGRSSFGRIWLGFHCRVADLYCSHL